MTLLDPKHLIAPFKNTVHLIAIVFIVLLFATYRLATGGVEVVQKTDQPVQPIAAPTSAISTADAEKMLNAIQPQPVKEAQGTPAEGDLKDIERALGLSK